MSMALRAKLKSSKRIIVGSVIVVAIASGAAFALLQGWGVITGNTISTANAGLLVSTDGVHYSPEVPGFSFSNLVPGSYPAPAEGDIIYLKNTGSTDVDLGLTLNDPPSDSDPDDLGNFNILLTDVTGNAIHPKYFSLGDLADGSQPLGIDLQPGATRQYKLQVHAVAQAQPGMEISNVDLAFNGVARDPNDPHQ